MSQPSQNSDSSKHHTCHTGPESLWASLLPEGLHSGKGKQSSCCQTWSATNLTFLNPFRRNISCLEHSGGVSVAKTSNGILGFPESSSRNGSRQWEGQKKVILQRPSMTNLTLLGPFPEVFRLSDIPRWGLYKQNFQQTRSVSVNSTSKWPLAPWVARCRWSPGG